MGALRVIFFWRLKHFLNVRNLEWSFPGKETLQLIPSFSMAMQMDIMLQCKPVFGIDNIHGQEKKSAHSSPLSHTAWVP